MVDGAQGITRDRGVIIIGRQSLQNRLLANLVEQRVGCACLVRPMDTLNGTPVVADAVALLDIESVGVTDIASHLNLLSANAWCRGIAVINADEGMDVERLLAWSGVRGVFYRDSSQENLLKGILAIFSGEYWLPRKILTSHLEHTRLRERPPATLSGILTRKETETLKLLASGNSNSYIAQKLCVSPHTVKTHLYNLFRKIQVNNRVQAVNWARQNIDGMDREIK